MEALEGSVEEGGEPRSTCPGLKRIESALREEAGLSAGVRLTKQVLARARSVPSTPSRCGRTERGWSNTFSRCYRAWQVRWDSPTERAATKRMRLTSS